MYALIGLVVAGLIIALVMRVMGANRDAQALMMQSMPTDVRGSDEQNKQSDESGDGSYAEHSGGEDGGLERSQIGKLRLQCEELRR